MPADLSLLSGTASQYSHKLGQPALKPVDWLQSWQLVSKPSQVVNQAITSGTAESGGTPGHHLTILIIIIHN